MEPSKSAITRTGCLWDSKPAAISDNTQQLLREFMQESKLTFTQQRKLKESIKNTGMLPTPQKPTSSRPRKAKTAIPKILNPKNYSGGVRTQNQIMASGDLNPTRYRPSATVPARTNEDKERLAFIMAFGIDAYNRSQGKTNHRSRQIDQDPDDLEYEEIDRFDELCTEIEDRRRFLDEMGKLGKDKQYRPLIETEISQKLREMEVIDKKQSDQLNKQMQEKN